MSGIISPLALPKIHCGPKEGGTIPRCVYGMQEYSFWNCLVTTLLAITIMVKDAKRWLLARYFILWYKDMWAERTKTHI